MTDHFAYQVRHMPNQVDIKCPECSSRAIFEFAQIIQISHKRDLDYFKNSKLFDYQKFQTSSGNSWHAAFFYHGLHSINEIKNLPEGYSIDIFKNDSYDSRAHMFDIGAKYCTACGYRRKAKLHWPDDAYYQCSIKDHTLWAFNQEYLIALIDYIQSDHRDRHNKYHSFLLHLPSIFLEKKNREIVVKKLNRLLVEIKRLTDK
jgi:hypothetical protein